MMARQLLPLAFLALLCAMQASASASTLTPQGLAPVHLGMSIPVAERALHARLGRLSRSSPGFSSEPQSVERCWYWRRRDGQAANIAYMTERGHIVRIDIGPTANVAKDIVVTTAQAVGVGSPLGDVEKAYGKMLHLEPHPLEEDTQWAVVERDGSAGIRVEIRDGSVTAMFVAAGGALDYSEGCS